jgi:hypothetical protein
LTIQVRSSARGAERRRRAVVFVFVCVCVPLWPLPESSAHPQSKAARESRGQFRFQVTDSENDLPVPGAAVCQVYWQKRESGQEKMEIEFKTGKDGIADFPRLQADKLAVAVNVKGHKPYYRWFRPDQAEKANHIRLEKWEKAPK